MKMEQLKRDFPIGKIVTALNPHSLTYEDGIVKNYWSFGMEGTNNFEYGLKVVFGGERKAVEIVWWQLK